MSNPVTRRYSPLRSLVIARLREFIREPEAVFWVYGFPILMIVALGVAFRSQPVERVTVDIAAGPIAADMQRQLQEQAPRIGFEFSSQINEADVAYHRLRTAKTDLVVAGVERDAKQTYEYQLDKARAESRLARWAVHDALERAAGRTDPVAAAPDKEMTAPGSRYVDFLVPGLLGMSMMGGGLWGVGFVIVDMRIRKLLKRFLATPMKRSDFLLGVMLSRILFIIPEVLVMLTVAWLAFDVVNQGSFWALICLIVLGALAFSGIGLLVASRAQTLETVTGLMNLVMLPMWVLSGIFFSPDRFPAAAQPFIKALPLSALNNALRGVMLEGQPLTAHAGEIAILLAYALITFGVALKIFRWR